MIQSCGHLATPPSSCADSSKKQVCFFAGYVPGKLRVS